MLLHQIGLTILAGQGPDMTREILDSNLGVVQASKLRSKVTNDAPSCVDCRCPDGNLNLEMHTLVRRYNILAQSKWRIDG